MYLPVCMSIDHSMKSFAVCSDLYFSIYMFPSRKLNHFPSGDQTYLFTTMVHLKTNQCYNIVFQSGVGEPEGIEYIITGGCS